MEPGDPSAEHQTFSELAYKASLGTNMGIKRVAVTGKHGESEATLRRVRHLFVNRANMRAALVKLMNATFAARDEMWWGTGTACASDSRKFGAWSSNLMTERHQRYRTGVGAGSPELPLVA